MSTEPFNLTGGAYPKLPPQVVAKLAARGVTDDEGLVAAMQADPVLRAEIQTFLAENQSQIHEWLVKDLLAVKNSQEMTELLNRAPFILEDDFLASLGQLAAAAQEHGNQAVADALTGRLASLVQIRQEGKTPTPQKPLPSMSEEDLLYQMVQAFIYAEDEATARQVFAEAPDLLLSDDARQILDHGIEADNEQSQRRLTERKTLLRKLRREVKG